MKPSIRLLPLVLLMLGSLLLLPGCFTLHYHITVNSDETIDEEITFIVNKSLLSMGMFFGQGDYTETFTTELFLEGFEVENFTEGDASGVKAYRTSTQIDDSLTFTSDTFATASNGGIVVKRGLFSQTYYIDETFGMGETSAMEREMLTLMQPDIKFLLTLPVKPIEHNADVVSSDGKTMEWIIDLRETNNIKVSFKEPYFNPVLILVILASIVLVAAIMIFSFRHIYRNRGDKNLNGSWQNNGNLDYDKGMHYPTIELSAETGSSSQADAKKRVCAHCGLPLGSDGQFCPTCSG